MAQKKIDDLQLRSSFDDTCSVPVADATQTWRSTGAQILAFIRAATGLVTGLTAVTDLQAADLVSVYDASATAMRKVTKGDLIKKMVNAKTASFTASVDDEMHPVDATAGAVTATLPDAVTNKGKAFRFSKTDTGTNAVIVTRAGSDTIEGTVTRQLNRQYDYIDLFSDGTTVWKIRGYKSTNRQWFDTGNGHGSTNTKSRKFTNNTVNLGIAMTSNFASGMATSGLEITFVEAGFYSATWTDRNTGGGADLGISIDPTADNDPLLRPTGTDVVSEGGTASGLFGQIHWSGKVEAGQKMRFQDDGNLNVTTNARVWVERLAG